MTREEIVALFDRREGRWRSRDAAALAHDHALTASSSARLAASSRDATTSSGSTASGSLPLPISPSPWKTSSSKATASHCSDASPASIPVEFFGMPATSRRIDVACGFSTASRVPSSRTNAGSSDFTGLSVQVGVLRAKPGGGISEAGALSRSQPHAGEVRELTEHAPAPGKFDDEARSWPRPPLSARTVPPCASTSERTIAEAQT